MTGCDRLSHPPPSASVWSSKPAHTSIQQTHCNASLPSAPATPCPLAPSALRSRCIQRAVLQGRPLMLPRGAPAEHTCFQAARPSCPCRPCVPQPLHDLATIHSSERYCGGSAAVGRERQARRCTSPFQYLRQQSTAPCCATVRPCIVSAASLTLLLHGLATVRTTRGTAEGAARADAPLGAASSAADVGTVLAAMQARRRAHLAQPAHLVRSHPRCVSAPPESCCGTRPPAAGAVASPAPPPRLSLPSFGPLGVQVRLDTPAAAVCSQTAPRSCYSTYNERYCGGSSAALRRSGAPS